LDGAIKGICAIQRPVHAGIHAVLLGLAWGGWRARARLVACINRYQGSIALVACAHPSDFGRALCSDHGNWADQALHIVLIAAWVAFVVNDNQGYDTA
jgi:hypothetical protein